MGASGCPVVRSGRGVPGLKLHGRHGFAVIWGAMPERLVTDDLIPQQCFVDLEKSCSLFRADYDSVCVLNRLANACRALIAGLRCSLHIGFAVGAASFRLRALSFCRSAAIWSRLISLAFIG